MVLAVLAVGKYRAYAQTPVWSDEFDGPAGSQPDPAKWNMEVVADPANSEAQFYTDRDSNVSLNGAGMLVLTAYKEQVGDKQYTSGRINSANKFSQAYGSWMARMKLPPGVGMWPAFWMLGTNNGCGRWPACGEIDIMENRGRLASMSSSAMHGPGYSGNTPLQHVYNLPTQAGDFFSGFHLFACEWTETQVRFFVDGNLHYTVTKPQVEAYGRWVYDHPFYAVLNLAIGGHFDGGQLPPDSAFPAQVVVDFVRVYSPGANVSIRPIRPGVRITGVPGIEALPIFDFMGRRVESAGEKPVRSWRPAVFFGYP